MRTKPIPSTGEQLPVIGLGTWKAFDVGESPTERGPLETVMREFVALGGTLVDSSPMYGQAESVVGAITEKLSLRNNLFVATKVWTTGKLKGIAEMEESMRKLRAKRVDLMQVHNLLDVRTHLATLDEWKQAGLVRYVGVTHYTAAAHDDVARVLESHPVDFLQINYSVAEREAERRLLPMAQEKGIAVIANRPLLTGDLMRSFAEKPLPGFAAEIDCSSWAQLLLKFVVSHPAITCAIPATANVDHLRDNMKAGEGRLPDAEHRAKLAALAL